MHKGELTAADWCLKDVLSFFLEPCIHWHKPYAWHSILMSTLCWLVTCRNLLTMASYNLQSTPYRWSIFPITSVTVSSPASPRFGCPAILQRMCSRQKQRHGQSGKPPNTCDVWRRWWYGGVQNEGNKDFTCHKRLRYFRCKWDDQYINII